MIKKIVRTALPLLLTLLVVSCSKDALITPEVETTEVSLTFNVEGTISQTVQKSRAAQNLVGYIHIHSHETQKDTSYAWYVTLDEDAKTITSNQTLTLPIGAYDFTLDLKHGDNHYVGTISTALQIGKNDVNLSVKPVIGSTGLNFNVNEIPKLRLKYPVSELGAINDPRIGYSFNGGAEVIVSLSKATGENSFYINLPHGDHRLKLNFYDGNKLIGTSIASQEAISVKSAINILMDIIPLYAKGDFTLTLDGADATFDFTVPAEVVAEVGGLANLQTHFTLTSQRNGVKEELITVTDNGGTFTGTVTIPNYYFDVVSMAVSFKDVTADEVVGTAAKTGITINSSNRAVVLPLDLIRRAVVTGNILSVVGVNVFDELKAPFAGVSVLVDGELKAITGSGNLTAAGHASFYVTEGTHTVTVTNGSLTKSIVIDVNPLDIKTYFFELIVPRWDVARWDDGSLWQ